MILREASWVSSLGVMYPDLCEMDTYEAERRLDPTGIDWTRRNDLLGQTSI